MNINWSRKISRNCMNIHHHISEKQHNLLLSRKKKWIMCDLWNSLNFKPRNSFCMDKVFEWNFDRILKGICRFCRRFLVAVFTSNPVVSMYGTRISNTSLSKTSYLVRYKSVWWFCRNVLNEKFIQINF